MTHAQPQPRSAWFRAAAIALVAALLLTAVFFAIRPKTDSTRFTLQFTDITGLYVGNDVQTIGVRVGEITKITPNGTRVDVEVEVDEPVSADVGAVIMQSSLVTDRFIELTPPWTDGPTLADGAVVPLERTKAPANVDDIFAAVDDLLVALSDTTEDGKNIGDLLSVSAEQLQGKGEAFADLLDASAGALSTVGGTREDLTAIVDDADALVTMLAERDATIRSLVDSVADSADLFAGQRDEIADLLALLDQLSRKMSTFITDNDAVMVRTVERASRALQVFADERDSIASAFNAFPVSAENIANTYSDAGGGNLRVRVDVHQMAPYGKVARENLCQVLAPESTGICDTLLVQNSDFFDQFSTLIAALLPGPLS